ncbi:MAG TPA: hypothetical protein VNG69_13340 [Casimicrobiaceae bacterium]|nr:hypothetical protein [Casimicrobiaceae bacterium]
MPLEDALRQRGFRRWYERQLIESHAYLVTGFLSLIMMAIALETLAFRESIANAIILCVIALCGGALCIFAWNRFKSVLFAAEALAEQAVCTQCRTYGRFEVMDARASSAALFGRALTVRCRKCQHCWRMA